jgi:hypothetical protein
MSDEAVGSLLKAEKEEGCCCCCPGAEYRGRGARKEEKWKVSQALWKTSRQSGVCKAGSIIKVQTLTKTSKHYSIPHIA